MSKSDTQSQIAEAYRAEMDSLRNDNMSEAAIGRALSEKVAVDASPSEVVAALRALAREPDGPDGSTGYQLDGTLVEPDAVCRCGEALNWHPVVGCELNGGAGAT